jgi:solute carrier family 30 (zinc transporter), member 9
VYTAIAGNTAVMVAKLGAFAVTGSAAMLSEGIHSMADVGNQSLLALGIRKSEEPPSPEYPYGRRRERFVWALISAVGIFFLGCGVTVYHGVDTLLHPHFDAEEFRSHLGILAGVLLFSFVVEGGTLLVAIRAVNEERAGRGFLQWFNESPDPMGPAVVLEDGAAVTGVAIAAICVALTWFTGNPVFDSIGSIIIGLMLGVIAVLLVQRNRELLLGEAPVSDKVERISDVIRQFESVESVHDAKAIVLGSDAIRYKAEIDFDGRVLARNVAERKNLAQDVVSINDALALQEYLELFGEQVIEELGNAVDRIEEAALAAVPEIAHMDLEAD